ncbi:MAG: radical SAM protein [Clostridia bacterium]|nr:radical SAM protein [Clostridia bacterium]
MNMNKKPKVLVFSTDNNKYIFDNVSGNVFHYSDEIMFIINNFFRLLKDDIIEELVNKFGLEKRKCSNLYLYIENLINNGCFYNEMAVTEVDCREESLKTPMSQLILVLTEQCNLRCKYCIYSEHYPNVIGYSNKSMDFETAKRAIDQYMQLYNEKQKYGYRKKAIISFYGGEPFLKFDVIKQVIKYCREKGYEVRYYVTTNGTIMNEEIIEYIVSNDFIVTFSVDGYKEQHDRNRVFAGNKGTFDSVFDNIERLQNYKRKRGIEQLITFNCTYDHYSDLSKIIDFFVKNYEKFDPFNVMFGPVNKLGTTYYDYCKEMNNKGIIKESSNTAGESYKHLLNKLIETAGNNNDETKILNSFFASLFLIKKRPKGLIHLHSNACMPSNKIAVSPDGDYYVCERINQKFKIGDINSGINWERCSELLNKYMKVLSENCEDCNLSRLCDSCYIHFVKDENNIEFDSEFCKEKKSILPKTLSILYSLLEHNPKMFEIAFNNDIKEESIIEFYQVMK